MAFLLVAFRILSLTFLILFVSACLADDVQLPKREFATKEEFAKYRDAAWVHFQKRCKENAGERIYREVEKVEGLFLERPRTKPSEFDLRDQYWMGNPYGLVLYPPAEISRYLWDLDGNDISTTKRTERHGFRFVEAADRAGAGFIRYSLDRTNRRVTSFASRSRHARYAVSWEDISSSEDRSFWIAGGRLQITDLSSKEVLGERVGYVFDAGLGSTGGGRVPWLMAQRNSCPPIRRNAAIDRLFVEKVLKPLSGD